MAKHVHGWASSLNKGKRGEDLFHSKFPWLIRTDGRVEDFILPSGEMLELKSESRTTTETPNLALELESSPGRPGAIARAVKDKIAYITYMFACGTCFTYSPKKLLRFMKKNLTKYRQVSIQNSTYKTTIILIPRLDVSHLEVLLAE